MGLTVTLHTHYIRIIFTLRQDDNYLTTGKFSEKFNMVLIFEILSDSPGVLGRNLNIQEIPASFRENLLHLSLQAKALWLKGANFLFSLQEFPSYFGFFSLTMGDPQ